MRAAQSVDCEEPWVPGPMTQEGQCSATVRINVTGLIFRIQAFAVCFFLARIQKSVVLLENSAGFTGRLACFNSIRDFYGLEHGFH